MSNKLLFCIALILIAIGLIKPNFDTGVFKPSKDVVAINVEKPNDSALLVLAQNLVSTIRENKVSKDDCLRLANICFDMSTLIALDGPSEIIKNTEEIRQANRLSGLMLRMDINKKYPSLGAAMNSVVVGYIGDDIVTLNGDLRAKATNTFQALAWAFVEGSK